MSHHLSCYTERHLDFLNKRNSSDFPIPIAMVVLRDHESMLCGGKIERLWAELWPHLLMMLNAEEETSPYLLVRSVLVRDLACSFYLDSETHNGLDILWTSQLYAFPKNPPRHWLSGLQSWLQALKAKHSVAWNIAASSNLDHNFSSAI